MKIIMLGWLVVLTQFLVLVAQFTNNSLIFLGWNWSLLGLALSLFWLGKKEQMIC